MAILQVDGQWEMAQSNGFRVTVNIIQNGTVLDATAHHSGGRVQATEATGFVSGHDFNLTITWDNGSRGQYTALFKQGIGAQGGRGYLDGDTVDLNHPGSHATWQSEGREFFFQ